MSLVALLDDGARHDAEYRQGLSNHLPMALIALERLGADETRLAGYELVYAPRLEPAPPAQPWAAGDDWTGRLGERAAWPAYRSLFLEWLEQETAGDVLQQVLPALMPGCGAAAFHGLIRTAYAAHARHRRELADALAYWACRHLPLDGEAPGDRHGLIFEQMQHAAAAPGFDAAVAAVVIDAGTLERLARDAARLYAASTDFTVLHLVTSAHALRTLLPYCEAPQTAVEDYVVAWVAALHASGADPAAVPAPATPLPWPALIAHALASDDEHLIKLVDSCREQEAAYGGAEWQRAASAAVSNKPG